MLKILFCVHTVQFGGFCCLFLQQNIVLFSLEKKGTAWADYSYKVGNHIILSICEGLA